MDFAIITLDRHEINDVLIKFTAIVTFLAIFVVLCLFCCGNCFRQRKRYPKKDLKLDLKVATAAQNEKAKQQQRRQQQQQQINYNSKYGAISIDSPDNDLDYIDAKNTNLISSTMKVSTLRSTPPSYNPA